MRMGIASIASIAPNSMPVNQAFTGLAQQVEASVRSGEQLEHATEYATEGKRRGVFERLRDTLSGLVLIVSVGKCSDQI